MYVCMYVCLCLCLYQRERERERERERDLLNVFYLQAMAATANGVNGQNVQKLVEAEKKRDTVHARIPVLNMAGKIAPGLVTPQRKENATATLVQVNKSRIPVQYVSES